MPPLPDRLADFPHYSITAQILIKKSSHRGHLKHFLRHLTHPTRLLRFSDSCSSFVIESMIGPDSHPRTAILILDYHSEAGVPRRYCRKKSLEGVSSSPSTPEEFTIILPLYGSLTSFIPSSVYLRFDSVVPSSPFVWISSASYFYW